MSILNIAKGMGVTLSHLFKKPVTVQYPEEKAQIQARFRGRHHLLRHPDTGLEKCIGCSLCAAACPAYAIYVEAAENDPDDPTSAGERYASIYEINMLRCIFCGFCEEACPTGAVVLGHEFELDELADISNHGMAMGVGGFIYYHENTALFNEFIVEIGNGFDYFGGG